MIRYVVDASVAAKWLFNEEHTAAAGRLLRGGYDLWAPELVRTEMASIVWKRWRLGDLSPPEAKEVSAAFALAPLNYRPDETILEAALEIAIGAERSIYDSLYLALAIERGCRMVTADGKFFNALKNGPLGAHLRWVAQIEE